MKNRTSVGILCLGVVWVGGLIGCGSTPQTKDDKVQECSVMFPQSKENIQDYVEYTGRTAAMGSVDIKARVTGFLKQVLFKEGEKVQKGQELFLIDPEPYIAQLEQAQAQVGLYDAQVKLTRATYEQAADVAKKNPKTFSALQLRTYKAQMDEAAAGLKAAQASLKIYQINKDYTKVTSPIDGVVGRKNQTPGNVILQDQTLLTTVVSLDPLYVYFDMDAPTFAKFQEKRQGKTAPPPSAPAGNGDRSGKGVRPPKFKGSDPFSGPVPVSGPPIFLELPGGPSSSSSDPTSQRQGKIDFFNNQFNPATDTILVRGVFPNPTKKEAVQGLRPGMFVRVKLSIGQPYRALLVPDRAILSKMGKKYVYVVDADNRVREIQVVIGQLQEKGLRVIKGGQLTAKDRVILTRLLEIQPKQEIRPVLVQPSPGDKGTG